uniref:Lamina-associated polypeptide 2 alpha C-terminal domain-containing protein n=1 Tax=Micrurus lemniscatus lemniscatus TaxID=129467 RepID=A0A2D4J9D0_MICLE
MRDTIPATNIRAHQDVAKLIAAAEFSADATFNIVKFSSRAIASQIAARRLFWLRHWQANVKHKWWLASAPISENKLFGSALEPLLIETRTKKKILPSLFRRSESRSPQHFRRGSFHPFYQP